MAESHSCDVVNELGLSLGATCHGTTVVHFPCSFAARDVAFHVLFLFCIMTKKF